MAKRRNYTFLGKVELPSHVVEQVERMTADADAEIEATRVTFRWGKEQLDVVKKAADVIGVPYQTFLKLAVYQRALDVLKDAQVAKPKDAA
ncbi:MAG: hypothetical protein HY711_04605 [Candidatus Melainabacteria bacterium]|nr:hypothetical protein [Candidatus Melainabacteria bacterium]